MADLKIAQALTVQSHRLLTRYGGSAWHSTPSSVCTRLLSCLCYFVLQTHRPY